MATIQPNTKLNIEEKKFNEDEVDQESGPQTSALAELESGDAPLGKVTASASDYFTLMASGFALVSDGYQSEQEVILALITRSSRFLSARCLRLLRSSPSFTFPPSPPLDRLEADTTLDNLPTIFNPVFKILYASYYTSDVSTRVSNSLLVGEIIGQIVVGIICDRVGRKTAMVGTTLLIVIGGILATASSGNSKYRSQGKF